MQIPFVQPVCHHPVHGLQVGPHEVRLSGVHAPPQRFFPAGQIWVHDVPSQPALPPVGAGQGEPQVVPHVAGSMFDEHEPAAHSW
jgi:hypothetical protein